jgi:hypothetical protein
LARSRQPGQSYDEFLEQQSAYYRQKDPLDFTAREQMPYYWAKHNMRTPEERALNFSYAFLGIRIECAQCHKHPLDRWTQQDFQGFTAFFNTVGFGVPPEDRKAHQAFLARLGDQGNQAQRERARLWRAQRGEVVPWQEVYLVPPGYRIEKNQVIQASPDQPPKLLGGATIRVAEGEDPRQALMDWMRSPDNPYFATVFVNRIWSEYFGVGIIHPTDDLNQANPPSNAPLLDYLVRGFIASRFDMQWLHRQITNSQAYQRSMQANATNRQDDRNFSRAVARRLPAATLFDAIETATADSQRLAASLTQLTDRAIGPRGGAYIGRWSGEAYASRVFGRSDRQAICDCSASNDYNLLQAIYLQNDKDVLSAIERKGGWLQEVRHQRSQPAAATESWDGLIAEAFLRTVSRQPTTEEIARVRQTFANQPPIEALRELLWALLNTREFATNH